jgi:histidinol-phosphatase (PHP family)
MFLGDYHLHTYISQDGHETMPDMARAAAKAGMSQICVTDHCDMVGWKDGKPTGRDRAVISSVISDWEDMMKNDPPPITVRRGIELGEAHLFPEQAVKFAALPGLDFVIGSLHILRGDGDFYAIPYKSNQQCYALFDKYLDQSMEIAKLDFFDVMGHLGYGSRYMIHSGCDAKLDLFRYHDKIEALLRVLIQNGRGIELNVSGARDGVGFFPNDPILRLYRELGGEIITVGSDAHFTANAGQDVAAGYERLRDVGFRYVAVFKDRKPEFIKI